MTEGPLLNRLLITGAAGQLGRMARQKARPLARHIRLSDVADLAPADDHEEIVSCDLGDKEAVSALVEGCDGILHLGGISVEDHFSKILNSNIVGVFNLYEAARHHGMPRIIFASSNHAIGFHKQDVQLDASAMMRPDGLYGVSKCYGENMASLYHDKFGQETLIVRIGSCTPEPRDHRMLATWLSEDDFISLITCAFRAPRLGCPVVYGASNNDACWWDNGAAKYLGWCPKDNSEEFRTKLDREQQRPDPNDARSLYQGGVFTEDPIYPD
ncbi:MAG: NAD(P)-dependent oxidoreductase [Ahrensia sp.]|nr:NAD(P)-dependent oxidoreductase [Ahrensia sp.]